MNQITVFAFGVKSDDLVKRNERLAVLQIAANIASPDYEPIIDLALSLHLVIG